jgi:hypothetical protein
MASRSLCPPLAVRLLGLGVVCLLYACNGEDLSAPAPGVIAVIVSTTGVELDPDGYLLSLDDLGATAIGINSTRDLVVDDGSHALKLDGLAANCALQSAEGARRTVQVTGADTTVVTFDVLCSATTGAITIATTTTGDMPDPDGYSVTLDQGTPQPIGSNDLLTLGGLPAGDHTMTLTGIAQNCVAGGDNPRTVAVTPGAAVETTFAVVCVGQVHRWVRVDPGATADLTDVWGTSGSDVFVVGETIEPGHAFRIASVILHYDGVRWMEQLREADLRLRGVWGSSPNNLFAVGFDFFAPVGRAFHYDGTDWTEIPAFASDAEALSFESIWGSSAQDIFAVGGAFDGDFDLSLIYHFDGAQWQRMPVPGPVSPSLADVWGSAPDDVYAVGQDEQTEPGTGVVLHFDGATWSPVLEQVGLSLEGVWGSSATDVFVVGSLLDLAGDDFPATSAIWHYDGHAWSPMRPPSDAGMLKEVWGSSASDVYAVGQAGQVLHYDGSVWTASTQTDDTLLGIWGFGPGDVYAVGNGGRIIHGVP